MNLAIAPDPTSNPTHPEAVARALNRTLYVLGHYLTCLSEVLGSRLQGFAFWATEISRKLQKGKSCPPDTAFSIGWFSKVGPLLEFFLQGCRIIILRT